MSFVHEEAAGHGVLPGLGSTPCVTKLWECACRIAAIGLSHTAMRETGAFRVALRVLHEAAQSTDAPAQIAYSLALTFISRLADDLKVMQPNLSAAPTSSEADSVPAQGLAELFAALKRPHGKDRATAIEALTRLLQRPGVVAYLATQHTSSSIGTQGLLSAWGACPDSWKLRASIAQCMQALTFSLRERNVFAHVPNSEIVLGKLLVDTMPAASKVLIRKSKDQGALEARAALAATIALCCAHHKGASQAFRDQGMDALLGAELRAAVENLNHQANATVEANPSLRLPIFDFHSSTGVLAGWAAVALSRIWAPEDYATIPVICKDTLTLLAQILLSGQAAIFGLPTAAAEAVPTAGEPGAALELQLLRNSAICELAAAALLHCEGPAVTWEQNLKHGLQLLRCAGEQPRELALTGLMVVSICGATCLQPPAW
ncbi:hypothetical protein WJX72_006599 [[Myrmecia] bisecta]|uniref:Uncharacterized protein n=1 Tax=[Myrmecia] bisecta TaxID=41462 RepID=A0AAW1R7H8_9CHLO